MTTTHCYWCRQNLTLDSGVLVDETGGDVCGTREAQDPTATGTNPPHVPDAPVTIGDRVEVEFWRETVTGTVERIGPRSGMVFVRMDASPRRLHWFFPNGVRKI